jgi:hypothetical protein
MLVLRIEWKKSEDRRPETEEKKVRSTKWKKSEDRGLETEGKKYEVRSEKSLGFNNKLQTINEKRRTFFSSVKLCEFLCVTLCLNFLQRSCYF